MKQRTCDFHPEDEKFLEKFNEQLQMLTGMVEEMMVKEPQMILSPVMRRLLTDKAKEVESLHFPLRGKICVDNLGEPLKPYLKQ